MQWKKNLAVFCLSAFPMVACAAGIPTGTYVGGGDGAVTVIRVLSNQRVILGAYGQMGASDGKHPVQEAVAKGNGIPGLAKSLGQGRYEMTFTQPGIPGKCVVVVQYQPQKKAIHAVSEKISQSCVQMHGASWGYGFSSGSTYSLNK